MPSPAKPTFAAQQLADANAERDQLIDWVKAAREEYTLWHYTIHEMDSDLRQHNSESKHGWTQAQISEWEWELAALEEEREYYAKGLVLVRKEWTELMKDLGKQWPLIVELKKRVAEEDRPARRRRLQRAYLWTEESGGGT